MKPKNKKYSRFFNLDNIFLGLGLILFSVFLVDSYNLKDASSFLLPRMVSIFGIAMIVIMLISGYLKADGAVKENNKEKDPKEGIPAAYTFAFAVAYFFLTRLMGFMLATGIAIICFSYIMKFENKKMVVFLSVIIPLALYLAFVTLLKAPLPAGVIENLLQH